MRLEQPVLRGVNVGCGATPTPGFINLDNSLSVRIASRPLLARVASRFLLPTQRKFLEAAGASDIRWAVATDLPLEDASVDVVYSSHMFEHLSAPSVTKFLAEARRVLAPGGTLRLVVPDLARIVERYRETGDADSLVSGTLLATERPDDLRGRLRILFIGFRDHRWMYDARSLCKRLEQAGFQNPVSLPPGETTITEAGALNLTERADESIYVEARR